MQKLPLFFSIILLLVFSCKNNTKSNNFDDVETPEGMIWVEGKTFIQGAKSSDMYAMPREKPAHEVTVDGFFIDATEVTNMQFKNFVDATGYITIAEKKIDWNELKKQLPEGTPKPHDSILQPGSLIFNKNVKSVVNMNNYQQWWTWKIGANWQHPEGPNSTIEGKYNHPVVHIAYEDALAYCNWANRRLPTEAEWESAAQGNNTSTIFTWGNNFEQLNNKYLNYILKIILIKKIMTGTLNKVILIGHLGDDVKIHNFEGGGCIGRFPLATNESYTNKQTNEKVTNTEWHNIVVRNKAAEICQKYLSKGDKVYVEGRIKTRKWQDDKGIDRYSTEINCQEFTFLNTKNETSTSNSNSQTQVESQSNIESTEGNDDLPF